ncbi:MAG: acyl-CoA thioesterase [Muribaculaceae bacterium]|nr:acyl-CoA thioesterase [Muribaculaceae bacterium]
MTPIEYPASNNPRVPEATQPFRHITPIQLRFNDVDMIGHINNNSFLEYMDLGKTSYFNSVKADLINWKFINAVVVNVNCNFYSPGYFNEPIAVLTSITSISQRSLKLEQRIINTETGDVKCVGTTVMAGFDPTTAQSAEIDAKWINAICAFEERDLRVESNG